MAKFATALKPIVRIRVYSVLKKWSGAVKVAPTTQFICTLWSSVKSTPCDDALQQLIRQLREEFKGELTIRLKEQDLRPNGGVSTINALVDHIAGLSS